MIHSEYPENPIEIANKLRDAFGRLRTSDPVTVFDYQSEYDKGLLLWEETTVGSGSAAHDANEACVDMTVTTASGDKVSRQTIQYHRYQPGKSQLIMMTFVFAAGQANTDQRVGYFDDDNGIFLELSGTTLQLVRRTNTSGSPVDTNVAQASWNLNTLTALDITKAQIFIIDVEWLGTGTVRCGFWFDNEIIYVHEFRNANTLDVVYMRTANLPVRYEIENTGAAGSGVTMKAICCSVISEGGFEADRGYPFSRTNYDKDLPGNGKVMPILSIRPKLTFNSITNRGEIIVQAANGLAQKNNTIFEIVYDGTLTWNASDSASVAYSSVNANSITEYDTAANSIAGGIIISSFFAPAAGAATPAQQGIGGAAQLGLQSRLPMALNAAGTSAKIMTLTARTITGSASVSASLFWQELR